MKKIKVIMLLLMVALFTPLWVKADAGAPMSTYKVRVNNQKGAQTYEWNIKTNEYEKSSKVLEYDAILTINYEEIRNNVLYGIAHYIDDSYTIKLEDVTPVEVKLQDYKKDTSEKYYVFDDTCYFYKGPSKLYGKISPEVKLNVDSIIESKYYDEMWIYVEQNGVKGWVYKYSDETLSPYQEAAGMANAEKYDLTKIKTIKKVDMYNSPKKEKLLGLTIPTDTELDIIYAYSKNRTENYYYVKYNGKYGWIKTPTFVELSDGDKHNIIYYLPTTIEINNPKGAFLYAKLNNNQDKITVIPEGITLTSNYYASGSYFDWYQVEYNGKTGWINSNELYNYEDENNGTGNEEGNTPNTDINNDKNENSDKKQDKYSINNIIFGCVFTAIIISLTALVTTILINKKQKKK